VLRAADLVDIVREKRGTRIIWKSEQHLQKEKKALLEALKEEKEMRKKIEEQFLSLREKLETFELSENI